MIMLKIKLAVEGAKIATKVTVGVAMATPMIFLMVFGGASMNPFVIENSMNPQGVSGDGGFICQQDTSKINPDVVNGWLKGKGKLEGYGQAFYDAAKKYNTDVALMVAITLQETGNGTSPALREKNNPGGLMAGGKVLMTFATLEQGIDKMGEVVKRLQKPSIKEMGKSYAPVGAKNDPNGLNNYWVTNVSTNYYKMAKCTFKTYASGFSHPIGKQTSITSPYGMRNGRKHSGLDLPCAKGDPLYAVLPGKVAYANWGNKPPFTHYGNAIVLDHGDKLYTLYGHMSEFNVKPGDTIAQGSVIGKCGNSGRVYSSSGGDGSHLHFEVRLGHPVSGTRVDPAPYLK